MAMKESKLSESNFQDVKAELIKDLGDGWSTGLAYTKAWDKNAYYKKYSNGEAAHLFQILSIRLLQYL